MITWQVIASNMSADAKQYANTWLNDKRTTEEERKERYTKNMYWAEKWATIARHGI